MPGDCGNRGPLAFDPLYFVRLRPFLMKRLLWLVCLTTLAALHSPQPAQAQHAEYDALVATHASANAVPEALVHRVILRESRYRPALVGRGGTIGLMQIKLATARSLGYTGSAEGLRDPNTNLLYGVKYLAGAYHAANGDHARAMHYYASGYYQAAKRQRLELAGNPQSPLTRGPRKQAVKELPDANAAQVSPK
jgi:soluble lytic murein transglycosylase-like protein